MMEKGETIRGSVQPEVERLDLRSTDLDGAARQHRPTVGNIDEKFYAELMAFAGKPKFRGGAVENLEKTPMGKGHGNEGQPFDIETACYLKPVFKEYDEARRLGKRLFLVLFAGVKTIKSFTQEVCAAEHVCNGRGDVAIYFGSAEAAEVTATTRILDFFKTVPRFATKMESLRSRFDDTIGAVKFPDKTLYILSANLSNTQQKNLAFVGLQDAFVTGTSGMIKEMTARTTQYERECIIFLESQGGEEGDDFDRAYKDTNQQELHVKCPHCETPHVFNWKAFDEGEMRRPEDFRATLPRAKIKELEDRRLEIGEGGLAAVIDRALQELTAALMKPERRVAGFKRGDRVGSLGLEDGRWKMEDGKANSEHGEINEAEVLRNTCFECFHCGSIWRDDGEFGATRIYLDRSSHYVAARNDALPFNVGFNIPQWINRRLSWGKIMLEKLKAHRTLALYGNVSDLQKWWQKTAARAWSLDIAKKRVTELAVGSYETDPNKLIPDFHSRDMTVDAQKDLKAGADEDRVGSFWFVIRDWDKFGNSRQVARGFVESWEGLIAIQKFWKVPNQRFCIDASKWGPQIEMMAAMNYELVTPAVPHPITGRKDAYPSCWRLFYGDKRAEFRVSSSESRVGDKKTESSAVSEGQPSRIYTTEKAGIRYSYRVLKYRWSNISFELQLEAILARTQGMVRMESLTPAGLRGIDGKPDLITLNKEKGILTYEQQMSARYLTRVRGANKYEDIANREAHYRDCELMQLVRASQDGLLGHVAAAASEVDKPREEVGR